MREPRRFLLYMLTCALCNDVSAFKVNECLEAFQFIFSVEVEVWPSSTSSCLNFNADPLQQQRKVHGIEALANNNSKEPRGQWFSQYEKMWTQGYILSPHDTKAGEINTNKEKQNMRAATPHTLF